MQGVIFKYEIPSIDLEILLPFGSQVVLVGEQRGRCCIWVMMDNTPGKKKLVNRHFHLYGTGAPIPDWETLKHVQSFLAIGGSEVWHLFEVVN